MMSGRNEIRNRKHLLWMSVLLLVCILTASAVWFMRRGKGASHISGSAYYAGTFPLEAYFDYSQRDEAWASNVLGSSKDTMSSSGCLTCCIAASLKAQDIYDYTPGELNQLFNEQNVYNDDGAIVWGRLEEALPNAGINLDNDVSEDSINYMVELGRYPIVKVRRKSGAVHWIMLTGTEDESYDFTALDPIDGYVHLSDYSNTIYGVRVVLPNATSIVPVPVTEENADVFLTASSPVKPRSTPINPQGMNLEDRFPEPEGYKRIEAPEGSFQSYLRGLPLKPDVSPVLLYNGAEKGNKNAHAAVFAMPVFDSDLQQCADSVMRVYAEYFWTSGNYDKIAFHLTNGFLMDYPSWREGNRLLVEGNHVSWVKKASYDDSYETFLLYMKYVMMYAGTLSLDAECTSITSDQLQAGDMFIKGGSPGHCVMVADVAVNDKGETCFLLAQGYMPAQEFHILKNPAGGQDPWYYGHQIEYPFITPEYVFQDGSLKRWYGM